MNKSINLVVFLAIAFLVTSCATVPYEPYAREVKKRPQDGGIIALKTDPRPEDRAKAASLMEANCGTLQSKILEEGEVVVGAKTDSTTHRENGENQGGFSLGGIKFGSAASNKPYDQTAAETTQLREWQISYQCIQPAAEQISAVKKTRSKK